MGVDSEFQSLGLAVNGIGLDWGWDGIEEDGLLWR